MIKYCRDSTNEFCTIALLTILSVASLNICADQNSTVTASQLMGRIDSDRPPMILDVRTAAEYAQGHIKGAINISHTELSKRLSEISEYKSEEIVVYCRSGVRAGFAEKVLSSEGYTGLRDLEGHILKWNELGYPLER